jgi:hypothetical protein
VGVPTTTLAVGAAAYSVASLAAGTHVFGCTYSGDSTFTATVCVPVTGTIAKEAQTISFPAPVSPVSLGSGAVGLAATASSGLAVTFSVVSGPCVLSGVNAVFTGLGTCIVAADQAGNANYSAAAEVTRTIVVTSPMVTVTLAGTPNPVFLNNPITLTATLTATGGTPTGAVSFLDGGAPIGSVTLSGLTASLVTSTLSVGTHNITAVYSGDSNFGSATSAVLVVVVQDFSLTITNPQVTIQHGGTAVYSLVVSSVGGVGMASAIGFAVAGEPDSSGVVFSPATIATGSGTTNVLLTIRTPDYPVGPWGPGLGLMVAGGLAGWRKRRRLAGVVLLAVVSMMLAGLGGCGWGWGTQRYAVSVTASSGSLSRTAAATLTSQ